LALHEVLSAMPDPHPSSALPPGQGQKAWEMGRQAYLAWAVGKAIASASSDAQESLDSVEQSLPVKAEDLERVMKSM
jgi:kinetochore protein Mis12/MTW1